MVCPICNTVIEDEGVLQCPTCNEYLDVSMQKKKVNEAIARTGTILTGTFKSKRFFTFCILISVLVGLYAFVILSSLPTLDIVSGLYLGFGIVTLISAWKMYTGKTDEPGNELLKKFNAYYKLMHVMSVIAFVCLIVCTALIALSAFAIGASINKADYNVAYEAKQAIYQLYVSGNLVLNGGMTINSVFEAVDMIVEYFVIVAIVAIILLCIGTVYAYFRTRVYKSIKTFIINLEDTTVTYAYISPYKFSAKLIKVIAIIDIVIAGLSFVSVSMSALPSILQGVILIILAKLFGELNAQLEENTNDVSEQRRILDELIMSHKEEI